MQDFDGDLPHGRLVLDQQDGRGATGQVGGQAATFDGRGSSSARQVHADRGAMPRLGVDPDVPARLLDEAEHHGEVQPGALAIGLGGKERLEHPGRDPLGHTVAGVGHGQRHVIAGADLGVAAGVVGVNCLVARLDRQAPAAGHRRPT